ncbi:MAG: hypothetical protein KF778_21725 [Rhodocyclaceae bacterium]|nr:hypothetical protein [Rhodocyclaceae bacterium]
MLDRLAESFAAAHRQRFGSVAEGETVQLVTFRIEAAGLVPKASFQPQADRPDASDAVIGRREVSGSQSVKFRHPPDLRAQITRAGNRTQARRSSSMDTTTVVRGWWRGWSP